MKRICLLISVGVLLGLALAGASWAAEPIGSVSVFDAGAHSGGATWECTPGHKVEKHSITLDSGKVRYTLASTGCCDPSHGEKRPCSEGNFGMPEPWAGNWYWGGFMKVLINGTDATAYRVVDMRVLDTGGRGSFQIIWAHPDAEVGLRVLTTPGSNHLLAQLTWKPREGATIKTVKVQLTCYPSFFTAPKHRAGARHCQTPRTDVPEPQALTLVPDKDTYLYYYDTTFDVAKGEGEGPCAALVAPAGVLGGKVDVGDYAEVTYIDFDPKAGQGRLGFYDFMGQTNANAEAYLKAHGAEDVAELIALDFRPVSVSQLNVDALRNEANTLLADAADDGIAWRPKVEELLAKVIALKTKGDAGDWQAEAELATVLNGSAEMFWKLRIFAALNKP
jgi:hypothetical protein